MSRKRIPPFETEITAMGPKGVGIGLAPDGKEVHIRGAVMGTRVLVRPAGRKKGRWKGVRTDLIRPAPDHLVPPCPAFGVCGGCRFQEVPLERQRSMKLAHAREVIGPAEWGEIEGGPDAYHYRNKMEFSFGPARYLSQTDHDAGLPIDGRFLGLHAAGRFDRVVDLERCWLIDEATQTVLDRVRADLLTEEAPVPYHPRSHEGVLRHLQLRRGAEGVFIALFTATPDDEARTWLTDRVTAWLGLDEVRGIHWYFNDGVADVARGELHLALGDEHLVMRLEDKRFALDPLAFFQTNTSAAEVLYRRIGAALGKGHARLLDLYCGTGSIGIFLADHADTVTGIEVVEPAIVNARRNAADNGVNATYTVAKVEDVLAQIEGGAGTAAVVDPPRVGLHPSVAKALAKAKLDVLVYVACHAASLGRDRVFLEEGGWVLERCWAVDLFPQTPHLEVVARFVRPNT